MDLNRLDTQLFYWINQHHCTFSDWALWLFSQGWSWAIVLGVVLLLPTMRKHPYNTLYLLLGIGLCILLSDRISVLCFKDVFCRLRPCHALPDVRMFHTTCGGSYGFISSHAANVFSLAMFLCLRYLYITRHRPIHSKATPTLFSLLIFFWAILVGYSRPYLGKHYPGDVICGAAVGMVIGIIIFVAIQLIENLVVARQARKK